VCGRVASTCGESVPFFFTGDAARPGVSRDRATPERTAPTDDDPANTDECRPTPVALDADATRLDGVALVTCRLHNRTTTARAVRLRDELAGETLPPRRDGVPERGWDGDTYTTVLPPETTHAVGYASPTDGPLPDSPAALVAVGDPGTLADTDDRVGHARRELADWAPPEDVVGQRAVADGGTPDGETTRDDETTGDGTARGEETTARGSCRPSTTRRAGGDTVAPVPAQCSDSPARGSFADGTLPTVVTAYLDAAAERIDRAAATADGVQAATDALRDSHHTPVTLEQAVARDEAALRALADRAATLADRADSVTVPVDSLRRLS